LSVPSVWVFYRIVRDDPPTVRDFLSHKELGVPLFDPGKRDIWEGVSVYRKLDDAKKKAAISPDKGRYIAIMHIPDGETIRFAITGRRRESHFTCWGRAERLLACVVETVRVN